MSDVIAVKFQLAILWYAIAIPATKNFCFWQWFPRDSSNLSVLFGWNGQFGSSLFNSWSCQLRREDVAIKDSMGIRKQTNQPSRFERWAHSKFPNHFPISLWPILQNLAPHSNDSNCYAHSSEYIIWVFIEWVRMRSEVRELSARVTWWPFKHVICSVATWQLRCLLSDTLICNNQSSL